MSSYTVDSIWRAAARLAFAVAVLGTVAALATEVDCRRLVANGTLEDPASVSVKFGSDRIRVPASHAYFAGTNGSLALRPTAREVGSVLLSRAPEEQHAIDQRLRTAHGGYGNSFFQKVGEGAGQYFVPEIHGAVLPLSHDRFERLVQSTAPVLRALRRLLQGFYSGSDGSAAALGLDGMPAGDVARVVSILRASPYFEPKVRNAVLRDYPFLMVAGFDAALTDDPVRNTFFEYNLGTPSGLCHNLQLLESLRIHDPRMFQALAARLGEDDTFKKLRAATELAARRWTGHEDGISVVVSPGFWNAAHPDVAYIALFTGMPLVKLSSLYIDSEGAVRLNVGQGSRNPRVTGIYNRMDESYFLADRERGLGARAVHAVETNRRLRASLGLPLEDVLLYDYEYGTDGLAVDVRRNQSGQPLLQRIWDRLGADPNRPDVAPGNLLQAVHARRVFVSNLGGRTADDKSLFALLARWLSQSEPGVASPPRTLAPGQYEEFYGSAELSRWVVKRPDRSGADGVEVLVGATVDEQQEIRHQVRQDEQGFVVQEFVATNAIPVVNAEAGDAKTYAGRFGDGRFFVYFDADGNVSAGRNGILLRVARDGSALSNTSAGGGYGIAAVLDGGTPLSSGSLIPKPANPFLPISRIPNLRALFARLDDLESNLSGDVELARDPVGLESVPELVREVMDLVGREVVPVGEAARRYARGEIGAPEFRTTLAVAKTGLLDGSSYGAAPLAFHVNDSLGDGFPSGAQPVEQQRQRLFDYIAANGYPAMRKRTATGDVPVLLVNGVNVNYVQRLFGRTLGFQIEHQPSSTYDHGYVRVGRVAIDRDTPGRRRFGEIHSTGITWLDVEGNALWRAERAAGGAHVNRRIEVMFLPTEEEHKSARYYHALRRANVFGVPYWSRGDLAQGGEQLENLSEHCFTFSKGATVRAQANELARRLGALGIEPSSWRIDPTRSAILRALKARALGWIGTTHVEHDRAWFRPDGLDATPFGNGLVLERVAELTGLAGSPALRAMRLLASWDAAEGYASVLDALRVSASSDFNNDLSSPRVAAVLIYDFGSDAFGRFGDGSWASQGRTGQWSASGQSPLRY